MDHVIELADREAFKRCRRAWDLGSGSRKNFEPVEPPRPFDLGTALQVGLAAYYYPAMWQWARGLVRPIALESFHKSMRAQRERYRDRDRSAAFPEAEWESACARGEDLLVRYFAWAPGVDGFGVDRTAAEFDVIVPHPDRPGDGLLAADGGAIRLRGRVGFLVTDEHLRLWLMDHRMVTGDWASLELLALDERSGAACWALELQLVATLHGVIFNEFRLDGPRPAGSTSRLAPRGLTVQEDPEGWFRRTTVRKAPAELRQLRRQMAGEALEMTGAGTPVYPNPSPAHCEVCPFVEPCVAMNAGGDAEAILATSFRRRVPEVIPLPPRTGSCGPQVVSGWKTKGPGVAQRY